MSTGLKNRQFLFRPHFPTVERRKPNYDRTIPCPKMSWYGINSAGTQITQWDFQNKEIPGWTGTSSCVLEVPLRYLRPSIIYSVPRDRIVQRACYLAVNKTKVFLNDELVSRSKELSFRPCAISWNSKIF